MSPTYIYIPGNVPSLKNSKEIVSLHKKLLDNEQKIKHVIELPGREPLEVELMLDMSNTSKAPVVRKLRPILIPSKAHKKYEKASAMAWRQAAPPFRRLLQGHSKPYKLGFYFVRDSKRIFDYGNAIASCEDIMTTRGWIDDDNCQEIMPVPLGYHVDKATTGVYITVLPNDFLRVELPVVREKELDLFD